ncbi:MAG TPA: neutral/alkaline non-lysosomal ceramidase N-terminal domain-containing protein [Candidatus Paceibacterota bacterium]|nr:neutral/alkaline non-lysosomal ceramidase N-terminal domain-containing protein [Verrucomicrobiota bacterium]HRZ45934.1 neutral/alkaline non-lysosomal ceramidase N-terminal domain-containing protein [Candidatus Paceibacterota bacterium]HRZ93054.1 neutral/alkaline non-lysosomal ceramidase N-terminal domain-containing protein [Candidatus Paceibacterota bacterium]
MRSIWMPLGYGLVLAALGAIPARGGAGEVPAIEVGLAARDITPATPIRLSGYAGRNRPADQIDHRLWVQAMALRNPSGERFVFVSLDNCEVSGAFMAPVLEEYARNFQLGRGAVAVVTSHTHSAPVVEDTLTEMSQPTPADRERIAAYTRLLKSALVDVVGAALGDLQPSLLEHGVGRAAFAMNRRVYQGDTVVFGNNPDGPADWDVPVMRVRGTNGAVRAVLFGYACHGTTVRGGDDWYVVSGEYMAYARQHIEAVQPGATAMFLTGMGADADPYPRGPLMDARRHGLELAGAVIGVLDRPMRPVQGGFRAAFEEVELPLVDPPGREQLEKDAQDKNVHVRLRAESYLKRMDAGQPLPRSVKLPLSVVRIGDDLTFVLMAGEVVVDYSRRLKRLLAADHPWTIGYAYETPCYIPSARLIKEGGYETESSLIYYGFYGPFRGSIEDLLVSRVEAMAAGLRGAGPSVASR